MPPSDDGFHALELEQFRTIAEPHHFSILELTEIGGCRNDPEWVAKKLRLTKTEAGEALERLIRLGLLIRNGRYLKKNADYRIGEVPSEAIRRFHRATMNHALASIDEQGFDERNLSAITMAINPEKMPAAIARIKKFRREMMKLLEDGPRQKVYTLSIQLFRNDC